MAEGEGFEPLIRFPAYTLSKRAPSATRPPLHRVQDKWINFVDKPYVLRAETYPTRTWTSTFLPANSGIVFKSCKSGSRLPPNRLI